MQHDMFDRPVNILTGLGHPASVGSVMQVYRPLVDWPYSGRDTTHTFALNACPAALNGVVEPDTARISFVAFAAKHHLFAPDGEAFLANDRPRGAAASSVIRLLNDDVDDGNA